MNRRDMLKASLATLGAALSTDAEASPREDTPAAVARLRRRLERTRDLDLEFLQLPDSAPPEGHERAAIDHTLIRSGMRALLVTGAVMDLADHERAHADVQGLIAEVSPEIDHAVHGALLRLQTLPRADRRRVTAEIKRNPGVVEDVAKELEHLAGKGGASVQRRFHLRTLLQQATWQLTHQPLDSVIAGVVQKTFAQAALMPDAPGPAREGPWADQTRRLRAAFPPADDALSGVSGDGGGGGGEAPEDRARRLRQRAGVDAAVGGGLLVAGAALVGLGIATNSGVLGIGGLVILTGAVIMLVMALVLVIVAAAVASRGEEELGAGAVPVLGGAPAG